MILDKNTKKLLKKSCLLKNEIDKEWMASCIDFVDTNIYKITVCLDYFSDLNKPDDEGYFDADVWCYYDTDNEVTYNVEYDANANIDGVEMPPSIDFSKVEDVIRELKIGLLDVQNQYKQLTKEV